jgi:UDP-N-acetylmuramoyl-tripeptide--D-alanyl-D-alanine ligase
MKAYRKFVRWWMTPHLPDVHTRKKSRGLMGSIKKWFWHPIKRRIAKYYLSFLQISTNIKVIAITGSAGKTTTKDMIARVLETSGATISSKENIDPIYNIPSTILKTPPGTKFLVLEMGVEYPGEMNYYLWLARPDIGVITNIFPTHTKYFGDIRGVLKEKSKLAFSLPKTGASVLNAGDPMLKKIAKKIKTKVLWFKNSPNPLEENANAARLVCGQLGVKKTQMDKVLKNFKTPNHRIQLINHASGAMILDDSYNSNPMAAVKTLNYFNKISKHKKMAVLGDMLELGKYEEEGHRVLGKEVARSGFDLVIGVGKSSKFIIEEVAKKSKNTEVFLVSDADKAWTILYPRLSKKTSVLIKGSRSVGLESLVSKLG